MLRTAALTALALAAVAAPASATTLTGVDGRLHITAAAGETNAIEVSPLDTGPVIVRDLGAGATLAGCPIWNDPWGTNRPGDRICMAVGAPVVSLGDRDDSVHVADAGTELPIGRTDVDAGPGNDVVTTGISDDLLVGGDGDDTLNAGEQGTDRLEGGPGDDRLHGNWGADVLVGGPGADVLNGGDGADTIDANDGSIDTVSCGDGDDTVMADTADTLTGCEQVTVSRPDGGIVGPGPVPGPGGPSEPAPAPGPGTAAPRVALAEPVTTRPSLVRDRTAPKLTVGVKGRTLSIRASEAATVTVRAGARRVVRRARAGALVKVRVPGRARAAKVTAVDGAGNAASVRRRLR